MSTNFVRRNPRRRKKRVPSKKPRKSGAKSPLKKRKRARARDPRRRRKKKVIVRRKKRVKARRRVTRRAPKKKRVKVRARKPAPVRKPKRRKRPQPAPKKPTRRRKKRAPRTFERFRGSVYFNVSGQSYEEVVRFVYLLQQNGVKWFRFVRYIPKGMRYGYETDKTNYMSTRWMNLSRMALNQLRGLMGGMFVSGVDELVQVIILESQLPPGILDAR